MSDAPLTPPPSAPTPLTPETRAVHKASVRQSVPQIGAEKLVSGSAPFLDDLRAPAGLLHLAVGGSPVACGRILRLDLVKVEQAEGVVAVLTSNDIPGRNSLSATRQDGVLLASQSVMFFGQPLFVVVAKTRELARRAARLADIEIEEQTPLVTIAQALAQNSTLLPDCGLGVEDAAPPLALADHRVGGQQHIGGQEHFYLEGQIAMAVPGEGREMQVLCSAQSPAIIQTLVAHILNLPEAMVTCEVRRVGGAFGGKDTQAAHWAGLAALAAYHTKRPCKIRLDRDEDFVLTGKRHDARADWQVGYSDTGQITAIAMDFALRCGCWVGESQEAADRLMLHADNAYFLPSARIAVQSLRTHTVANAAFRGFGASKSILTIETIMQGLAAKTGLDALDVRKANLYGHHGTQTPYGMAVDSSVTGRRIIEQLEKSADYRARRQQIARFNESSTILKKGLALTPVKFGISFTEQHLNQAGALIHLYPDGSVHLVHGGTELGQGLYCKVAQIVADELGVPLSFIHHGATRTDKVPNASPTAASASSDLNGMAARNAALTLRSRLAAFIAEAFKCSTVDIHFANGSVQIGDQTKSFADVVRLAYQARVQLSASGFYKTPKLDWDRTRKSGRPFYYFVWGAACSEVVIDTMTGESKVLRTDILHDVGHSLNPALDRGQIEGAFMQGLGWLTSEELVFDTQGRLRTHAPSSYKIPVASDVPEIFTVTLWQEPNDEATIYRSKGVGEPPMLLAVSVFCALMDALASLAPGKIVTLDAPATPEAILRAIEALADGEALPHDQEEH
jgi:xanthine dehydrogenase large subunit